MIASPLDFAPFSSATTADGNDCQLLAMHPAPDRWRTLRTEDGRSFQAMTASCPQSPRAKFLRKFCKKSAENFGEILARFSSFDFQGKWRQKIHSKSSTFSTMQQVKFSLIAATLRAGGPREYVPLIVRI